MRAVIQRVSYASLKVDGKLISEIKQGFLVFLGVGAGDSIETSEKIVKKIALMRVFEDEKGKMNLSLADIGGEIANMATDLVLQVQKSLKLHKRYMKTL